MVKKPWVGAACEEDFQRYMLCVQDALSPEVQCQSERLSVNECKRLYYGYGIVNDARAGVYYKWMSWTPWSGTPEGFDEFEWTWRK